MENMFELDVQVVPTSINASVKDAEKWSLACSGPPTNTLAV
ncbi:hypothetical protein [Tumebacillus permanentifrigoris]|nr:hypothetical protein [Tumebacillus permanentifrigoris]